MLIGSGSHSYEWHGDWAKLPESIQTGYTHGVVVDRDGLVHVFNQSRHGVLSFEPNGQFVGAWSEFPSDRFVGAHGMTLVDDGGEQHLWLTDQKSCEVVKTTLSGETLMSIERPESYADDDRYSPTWVAQSSDGRIFVADGYGSSRISVYDADGKWLETFDGSAGAGAFACPHGVWVGRRPKATGIDGEVLYVTDRGNHRVQVFTPEGRFVKAFYQDHPCCFAEGPAGELLVPDLHAFINVYDETDRPVAPKLGDNQHEIVGHDGWPNVPHEKREAGRFNSPHGGTFDADGNIYIVEWINDGRITKLTRAKA